MDLPHGLHHGVLGAFAFQTVGNDGMGDGLRVGGAVKDGTRELKALADLIGIDQVSVMRKSEIAFDMADEQRLDVADVGSSRSGIPNMADGHIAFSKGLKPFRRKHIRYQSVSLVMGEDTVIVDGDSAGFLTPVLKSIEGQIYGLCGLTGPVFKDTEHTAFFVQRVEHC